MLRVGSEKRQDASSYWSEIGGLARSYRHGVTAYCRANGISKRAFYHWFGKLRYQHPEWKDDLKKNSTRAKKNRKTGGAKREIGVLPKATRRSFSAEEKARILKEVDEAPPGQIGAILRKEGIYSCHLNKWRREMREAALAQKKGGPLANCHQRLKSAANEVAKFFASNTKEGCRYRQSSFVSGEIVC